MTDSTTSHTTDDATVSVTYIELAEARGITVAAARRLTLRHRWPKHPGNDGYTRVLVPVAFMETDATSVAPSLDEASISAVAQAATVAMTDAFTDVLRVVPTLHELVASLQTQLTTAQERADQERQRAERAESRAQEAEEQTRAVVEQLTAERQLRAEDKERVDHAEQRANEAEAQARAAEERMRNLTEKLETEMTEHRRIVGLMAEQLATRRLWWPWRRRA
jgi:hypothetical protein